MEARITAGLTAAEGRRFGFPVGGAFLLLSSISAWRGHIIAPRLLAPIGLLLVLAGVFIPGHLGPVYRAWMGLAKVMSSVTTPIFLGVVYFLVLTPMAIIRRRIGGNPMRHTARDDSYWVVPPASRGAEGMEHQF